uniref:Putative ovule protein n=1 Tax=Solanum chacoense TaxID=4108 RepID=A0A0V0H606_SOLCH
METNSPNLIIPNLLVFLVELHVGQVLFSPVFTHFCVIHLYFQVVLCLEFPGFISMGDRHQ